MKFQLCLQSMSLLVLLTSLPASPQTLYCPANTTELTCPADGAAFQRTIRKTGRINGQHPFLLQQKSVEDGELTGQCLYVDNYYSYHPHAGKLYFSAMAAATVNLVCAVGFESKLCGVASLQLIVLGLWAAMPRAKKMLSLKDCPATTEVDKIPEGFVWRALIPYVNTVFVETIDDQNTLSGRCIQTINNYLLLCDMAIPGSLLAQGEKCFSYGTHDLEQHFIPEQRGVVGPLTFDHLYIDPNHNHDFIEVAGP
ncbi:hypothetical protein [Endozoicomonas lisbonensis]|uniref:Uncharacterized protein n=1 Tax=Endozoicomonas lisbonensis TaxID=3120522 RepID=A0ABV2SBW8_9GAMM